MPIKMLVIPNTHHKSVIKSFESFDKLHFLIGVVERDARKISFCTKHFENFFSKNEKS